MTEQNQTPEPPNTPVPPEDAEMPAQNGADTAGALADSSLDKTVELPQIEVEPQQLQPTAVMPSVPSASSQLPAQTAMPIEVAVPTSGLVPPPTDIVPPPVELDESLGDTSDFTMSDVTLGDAGTGRLAGWVDSLKSHLGSAREGGSATSAKSAKHKRRWGLRPWQWVSVGVGAVVLLLAVFIAVDAGLYYNKVHHGIKVAGQSVSGMTVEEATETLTTFADEAKERPITLRMGERIWEVLPDELGTTIDVSAAVAKGMALTRESDAFTDLATKIGLYFSDRDIPLEGTVDDARVDALLARVARTLDVPAQNAVLRVTNGTIEVVEGKDGNVVDREALRKSLVELLFTFHSTELQIPMVTTSPDVLAKDITPSLEQANVMISAELSLTSGGKTLATLTPDEIVTYLDVASQAGSDGNKTVPVLSAAKMTTLFDTLEDKVGTPGVDATFEMDVDTKTLKLIEGTDGEGLDREATAAALTQAAMSSTGRTVEVLLKPVPPDLSTEEVQAMGINDLLGEYATTPYTGTKDRQINVRLATKLCSGVFLAPGEEFNTDKRLGIRDAAHGWAKAPGIVGPGQLDDVYGGGICQVSTTLFNAVLVSGLEVTQRYNHSIYINHYPDGRDATVTAGGKNMKFRNDTDHYIFIYGTSTGVKTKFYIWGVSDGRKVSPIKFSGFSKGGAFPTTTLINKSLPVGTTKEVFSGQRSRRCTIERTVTYADGTSKTETWSSYYPMMPAAIETNPATTTTGGGTGTTATTAAPPTTETPTTATTTP